ncbi:MAG TPA: ABC transporter permease [Longimicrobium sp.]|nr:ABC transporter permease [Longimicrobium sp.]
MAWYHRLRNTMRPEGLSSELDRELEFHLAERVDELVAGGMTEEEARREARLRFGNPAVQKERTRDRDILPWLESLAADVRYALRSLRASPGFAVVAILSLGLAIGANTAIFSLIDAVMLRSLPVERPEELVRVTTPARSGGVGEGGDNFTNPLWEALRDRQDVFSGAFATADERFDLAGGGVSRPVAGAWVSGGYFSTLGVRPAAGRLVAPADDYRGCPPVAVVGHGFWRGAYGGSPDVVGKTLSLNGHPFEIVGVAAAGFSGVHVGRAAEVYVPLCAMPIVQGGDDSLDERSTWFLNVFGRRRPGMTTDDAGRRLAALAPAVFGATVPEDWPTEAKEGYRRTTLSAVPAANGYSDVRGRYQDALVALMAAVGLVLLIGCANVANLLLARASSRRHEVAVRLAIGAGRGRLVRQFLTESLLLSLLGAAVGLLLAAAATRLLVRYVAMRGERGEAVWLDLSLDGRVLAFTLLVATATAILFGLVPAWRSARVDPRGAMKANDRSIVEGHSRFGVGKALVVGQIALSLVLVVSAGLLLGTFRRLATLDPGFEPGGVLLASVDMGNAGIPEEAVPRVKREILERVRAAPGVESASASVFTPLSGGGWNGMVEVDGYTPASPLDAEVFFNGVSDGFFATLGAALLAGRDFDEGDGAESPPVAIVNESFMKKFFHGANPVGRRVTIKGLFAGDDEVLQVVGVVRDTKYRSMREEPEPLVFRPLGQLGGPDRPSLELELRGRGAASALVRTVTGAVGEVNGSFSIRYRTLESQMDASLARERMLATLSGLFGGLALLLAAVGLYGTMAYSVARRRNEIGIRIALGAARARVMRLVLGEAGRLLVAGLLLGGAGALVATRWVAPFLFGVAPSDPATWAISALALAAVSVAACALPAWRAARLDPNAVLRAE